MADCVAMLKELVSEIDFLEDERRRAYQDIERLEVENEKLKAEKEQLMFALGRRYWREMRSDALIKKSCRKYGRNLG